VAYRSGDILRWDGTAWSMVFEGAAEGIVATADVNAFDYYQGQLYLSWRQVVVDVPDAGRTTPWEVVRRTGPGSFEPFFDGREVGLTLGSERINALTVLDGSVWPGSESCLYTLLIGPTAAGSVRNPGEAVISFSGEDVLGFCMTQEGAGTQGVWRLVADMQANGIRRDSVLGLSANDDATLLWFATKPSTPAGFEQVLEYDVTAGALTGSLYAGAIDRLSTRVNSIDIDE
jgi:hypothetical protein